MAGDDAPHPFHAGPLSLLPSRFFSPNTLRLVKNEKINVKAKHLRAYAEKTEVHIVKKILFYFLEIS